MPKRTAPDRGRSSNGSTGGGIGNDQPSKKTRFLDPEEDPVNFSEQVDSALEDRAPRRNRVRNEGYDSDSSDDGEGVVESRKAHSKGDGAGGADNDDDDDMFAIDDKPDASSSSLAPKKKKKTEFMRLGDIEGQEFGKSTGSGDDSEDSSEPEDEDDAIRRAKAGMGYELSSFNMREEMEEGKFTEDGSYIRTVDEHAIHDRWMEGLDEKEIKQARKRKKQREREQQLKLDAEEREVAQAGGPHALEKELLVYLKKGESVLEALQRLGRQKKKAPSSVQPAIERVTHLSTGLIGTDPDIYSKTYEELVRAVRSSDLVDSSWVPPSADKKYEYKWASGDSPEVFGPFNEDDMKSWHSAAYFGPGGENIMVREIDGPWGLWADAFG